MKFQYSLQKIVDLRGSEKSMAEWEYAAALGKLRQEEDKMAELVREQRELEQLLEQTALKPTPLARINELQQYIDVLGERIKQQLQDVRSAEIETQYRQTRLADRMIDEKVWLNARDRAHERFKFEWLSKEQSELDEIAIVRASAAARLA